MEHKVYGIHAVTALIKFHPEVIHHLWILQSRDDQKLQAILQDCKNLDIPIETVDRKTLETCIESTHHQGVIAFCRVLPSWDENWLYDYVKIESAHKSLLFLVLDGVQDPHNLGACLRSSNAFGVDAVIIPKDRAVSITPVVRKVASGAAEITPVVSVTNLTRTIEKLQALGVWFVGLSADSEVSISSINATGHLALILGAEGTGLRRLTAEKCDFAAKIPMVGVMESLNVSVSAGICLYEVQRQRQG